MYEVLLNRDASRTIERFTSRIRCRVLAALDGISTNPLKGKRLHGELEGLLSLRVGEIRVVYEIDPSQRAVVVHAIGSRGDVYKRRG